MCAGSTLSLIRLDERTRYVTLDGGELPVWDDARMARHRFRDVSIVPQYAMSALNPTRKVGRIAADLLSARGEEFGAIRPELVRRLELEGLTDDVLGMYPIALA
jgi:peptide/nickel transport system ATP-binding protein